jgi:hypothetical protein
VSAWTQRADAFAEERMAEIGVFGSMSPARVKAEIAIAYLGGRAEMLETFLGMMDEAPIEVQRDFYKAVRQPVEEEG